MFQSNCNTNQERETLNFTFIKQKQCYSKINTFTSATSFPNFSYKGQYKPLKPIQRHFLINERTENNSQGPLCLVFINFFTYITAPNV